MARLVLLGVPLVFALVAACGTAQEERQAATTTTTASVAPVEEEDFEAQATDFVNLNDMVRVGNLYVANSLGHLDEAVAVAESPKGKVFPVGTILQLVPQEAMVKRHPGYDPDLGDWEFFELGVDAMGTTITKRGGAEIVNAFGKSCGTCHVKSDIDVDFICGKDGGCDPLPIGDDVFAALAASDPRPRTATG